MGGGVNMEESVTLKLGRYEALRDKARRVDALEKENVELREKLNGTTDVIYEMVDVIDFEMINKEIEKLKEMNESLKMRLNDEKRLYEYKFKNEEEKHAGTIEKQDTENYDTPDELLTKLIQKQGLHATYLQIKELLNRQSK